MADVHSREVRSKNMAAIKGKDTKPEMLSAVVVVPADCSPKQ
jgi:G:T-mismatch repair DNA endonuclease (very short patch repair protein)